MQGINTLIKAIDSVGDPPLPIPNREVKPDSADGTAKICGRVGHRHFYRKRALVNAKARFFAYIGVDNILSWRWRPRFPVAPHAASLSAMLRVTNCCRHRRSCSRSLQTLKQAWCFTRLPATLWESRSSPLFQGAVFTFHLYPFIYIKA